jgi:Putative bacterial sensory transduction regulator
MKALAALTAAFALLGSAAHAQTPQNGLAVADVSQWIASKGGVVSAVQRDGGQIFFTVQDGGLTWAVFFYGCTNDVCEDIQYSAAFANPSVTLDAVNAWNTQQRFLKAFYSPGAAGQNATAAVQFDVLLQGESVDQLTNPTAVWIGMLPEFAVRVGGMTAAPAQ